MNLSKHDQYRTIIDGYNLIFQCGLEGRSRTAVSVGRARASLTRILAGCLDSTERSQTAIVFDAKKLPINETMAVSKVSGITVIYAIEHDDADTLIEELIKQNSVPKRLVVVSSDHRIHKAALRRNSQPIDSDVWYDQVCNVESEPEGGRLSRAVASDEKDTAVQDLGDVDWEKEFGLNEPSESAHENKDGSPKVFDPFPPGYADDIEGEFG